MAASAESIAASADSMAAVAEPIVMVQDNKPSISVHISYPNRNEKLLGALINPRKIFGRVLFHPSDAAVLDYSCIHRSITVSLLARIGHSNFSTDEILWTKDYPSPEGYNTDLLTFQIEGFVNLHDNFNGFRTDSEKSGHGVSLRYLVCAVLTTVNGDIFKAQKELVILRVSQPPVINCGLTLFVDFDRIFHIKATLNKTHYRLGELITGHLSYSLPYQADQLSCSFPHHVDFTSSGLCLQIHEVVSGVKVLGNERKLKVISDRVIAKYIHPLWLDPVPVDPVTGWFPLAGIVADPVTGRCNRICADTVDVPFTFELNTNDLTMTDHDVHGVFGVKYIFKLLLFPRVVDEAELFVYRGGGVLG